MAAVKKHNGIISQARRARARGEGGKYGERRRIKKSISHHIKRIIRRSSEYQISRGDGEASIAQGAAGGVTKWHENGEGVNTWRKIPPSGKSVNAPRRKHRGGGRNNLKKQPAK